MSQTECSPTESINYFFTRAKDTHRETGSIFITLFARLTREYTRNENNEIHRETESVWADIQEVKQNQAIDKIAALPNGIYTYRISEDMFNELLQLSAACPEELYQITPIHGVSKFKRFD